MRFGIGKRVISLFLSLSFGSFSVDPCLCAPLVRKIKKRKIYRKNPGENKFNAVMGSAVARDVRSYLGCLWILLETIEWFKKQIELGFLKAIERFTKQSLVVNLTATNMVVMSIFGKRLFDVLIDDTFKVMEYIWSKFKNKDAKWEEVYGVRYDKQVEELIGRISHNILLIRPVINLLYGYLKVYYGLDFLVALVDGYNRALLGEEKDCVLSLDNIASDSLNKVGDAAMSKDNLFHIWSDGVVTKIAYSVGFFVGIVKKGNANTAEEH